MYSEHDHCRIKPEIRVAWEDTIIKENRWNFQWNATSKQRIEIQLEKRGRC